MSVDPKDLARLKFNLQEKQFPYFEDSDLEFLLEEYGTVNAASYEGCCIKAHDDSVSLGPINTPSNENYWERRANQFRVKMIRERDGQSRVTSFRRADDEY